MHKIKNSAGFSIIEILVSLLILGVIFVSLDWGGNDQKDILKELIDNFDRSIRYAQNEAILLGKVTRIRISLDDEIEYVVEKGSKANILLNQNIDLSRLSLREREEWDKKNKKTNQQFSRSGEYAVEPFKVEEPLTIIGVGHPTLDKVQMQGDQSIYFYPSGERTAAIIFFSSEYEFATLEIDAFSQETRMRTHTYSEYEIEDPDAAWRSLTDEYFFRWKKE